MIVKTSHEIYLDFNATTPVLPAAVKEAHDAMQDLYGNPSSTHTSGLRARFILESARDLVRQVLGADKGQFVFTSGATEAIQMGIFSVLCQLRERRLNGETPTGQRLLLYGATEHKAVPQALQHWARLLGVDHAQLKIPVDRQGRLDLDFIRRHAAQADLICTMAVNNETGVITDLAAVETAIRDQNKQVPWLVDCVQAIGKLKLDLAKTTIDYAAISGHKIYAPKGIGLLYARPNAPLVPLLAGGGQEHGARGGTENLPGVAAIAAVLKLLVQSDSRAFGLPQQLTEYRDRIVAQLKRAFPTIVFNTPFEQAVPTTINFAVKGFPSKELLDLFDAAGIRVSSGSACGSAVQGSYVLEAMGLPRWQSDGAIRLSFGPLATDAEISAACEQIEQAGRALCESCLVVSPDWEHPSRQPLNGLVQLKNGSMCTWLLFEANSQRCVVIDPFAELAERIESLIRCQGSQVVAILETRELIDRESCRQDLLARLSALTLTSASTDDRLGWPAQSDGMANLSDGSVCPYLKFADDTIVVPVELVDGTPQSRVYLVGSLSEDQQLLAENVRFAFSGELISMGDTGSIESDSDSSGRFQHALRRLSTIILPHTVLCPTQDRNNDFATTLHAETCCNAGMRRLLQPVQLSTSKLDPPPTEQPQTDPPRPGSSNGCPPELTQVKATSTLFQSKPPTSDTSIELCKHELKAFFEQHRNSLIIDVREPHEFAFAQDWSTLGFDAPPENVPLTRLTGQLPRLLNLALEQDREVIFICRSGKRSGKAAEIVRRLGVSNVHHITGGIALNVSQTCATQDSLADTGFVI